MSLREEIEQAAKWDRESAYRNDGNLEGLLESVRCDRCKLSEDSEVPGAVFCNEHLDFWPELGFCHVWEKKEPGQ